MFLIVHGPAGHVEQVAIDSAGFSLGALFKGHAVSSVLINGTSSSEWQNYVPKQGERIEVTEGASDFGISAALATAIGVSTATATAIVSTTVSLLISLALSGLMRALTPKPKKPKLDSDREEAFGIGGFTNTTGRGTPAFVPYGRNRVWGHVISSGATLSPDGREMWGRILYFMGDTGGDGIESVSRILIDGTEIEQYPEITVHTRMGTNDQTVIPEFENQDTLRSDGRQLAFDPLNPVPQPVIYTTVGSNINRATLFIYFPGGLYRTTEKGSRKFAGVRHKIEIKPSGSGTFTEYTILGSFNLNTSGFFRTVEVNFPSPGKWDIRVTVTQFDSWEPDGAFIGDSILFNVQETVFTTKTYPGWALLGLTNIPAKKIRSLESMNVSALEEGKKVKVPFGDGSNPTLMFTRARCWIVMDIMTHPIVGMGSEIDLEECKHPSVLGAWQTAQAYYDEGVQGHDGIEARDYCDYILSDSDWDWEHVKKVAGEGRGRVVPSGQYWKYVIDKPDVPNLLYTEGANVIDGTINQEISPPDKPFTEISGQFRDADKDYEENFSPPIKDPEAVSVVQELQRFDTITRESEVQRENMIVFKRNFLERRRWSFMSPMGAIVSEPMDLDYFAERGIGGEGAYGGLLPEGATTTSIPLPDVVTLKAGSTYALIIKHRRDNTTEYRTVATGAGVWGLVTVTAPYLQAPDQADAFSLGIQDVEHIVTRAQDIEIDKDGRVRQLRTEYIPAVYTQDPLPAKSARKYFNVQDNRPPIPLIAANVQEDARLAKDGSTRSILIFDVTPGLPYHGGTAQGGAVDKVILDPSEPDRDGYYGGAQITFNGEVRRIVTYIGANREAFVDQTFSVAPFFGAAYVIEWTRYGAFGGFRIEYSEDGTNFTNYARVKDTHYEQDSSGAGPGPVYFRFTPFSETEVENTVARLVLPVTLQGDLSAPAAPLSVTVTSYLLNVRVLIVMQRPVAEDFAGVEVELWRNAIGTGTLLEVSRFGAPTDTASSGTMQVEATFNLGARIPPEDYGNVIWARARSVDFSQNYSAFVNALSGTTLVGDENVIGGGPSTVPSVPTGLTLSTGTQQDPVDGTWKVYLQISWNANPESNVSHYEVQFGINDPLQATTVRFVTHPQISIRELGVVAGMSYRARVQAINFANRVSGFTAYTTITTGQDTTAPPPPMLQGIMGGFRIVSIFFAPPPNTQDFECVEAWYSLTNDSSTATKVAESAQNSSNITVGGLADNTTYFFWLRARDYSKNVSLFHTGQNAGSAATTTKIGPGDIVTTNLITQSAQIANAVITSAHIQSLLADSIIGGTLQTHFFLGVGNSIIFWGQQKVMLVTDDNGQTRIQLGRLGPAPSDYGLQIIKANGSLMYSFTEGVQTQGRQEQNVAVFAVSIANGTDSWFNGVFPVENNTSFFTVRVGVGGRTTGGAKGAQPSPNVSQYADFSVGHSAGKTMAISPSLVNIVNGTFGAPSTATLMVHYW